jgi:dienelactone hydrolase
MLLVNGAADSAVPPSVPKAMAARLADFKVPVETYVIADVGHGFIGKTPEVTREANRKALERSFAFIDKVLSQVR